jgi:NAD+ kinase
LFNSVAIISRTDKDEAIKLAKEISSYLENRGVVVSFEKELADKLKSKQKATDFEVDLIITIGGDGTVLRAFHMTNGLIPILPIRMGTVGFLCDEDWNQSTKALGKLLRGEFSKDECFSLQSNLDTPLAMNEFRLGCALPSHPIEVEVYVDESLIARDKLDGIIISTNTGASAYALSAGANIIDPRLEAIMIVPICALSTNFKPYIVPSDSTVTIKVIDGGDLMTLVDGEYQSRLAGIKEIKIFKSNNKVSILRTGPSFYERLKRRLNMSSAK